MHPFILFFFVGGKGFKQETTLEVRKSATLLALALKTRLENKL